MKRTIHNIILITALILFESSFAYSGLFDDLTKMIGVDPACNASPNYFSSPVSGVLHAGGNVFKGPKSNCASLGQTQRDTNVIIIGQNDNWYLIQVKDQRGRIVKGWALMDHVSRISVDESKKNFRTKENKNTYSKEIVFEAQQLLKQKGYNVGVVDGFWGKKTEEAVISFQKDSQLEASGKLNIDTLAALKTDSTQKSMQNSQSNSNVSDSSDKKRQKESIEVSNIASEDDEYGGVPYKIDISKLCKEDNSIQETDNETTATKKFPIISECKAIKLITQHIGTQYDGQHIITKIYFNPRTVDNEKLKAARKRYEKLERHGLGVYTESIKKNESSLTAAMGAKNSFAEFSLTKKGKKIALPDARKPQAIYIRVGRHKIIKIVSIDDDNTVLFGYQYIPDEIGISLGFETIKKRGKAHIIYDPFLEEYKFKGFATSPWEYEDWKNNGGWIIKKDKKYFFTLGIE